MEGDLKILNLHECPADARFRPAEECINCPIGIEPEERMNANGCSDCATMVRLKKLEAKLAGNEPKGSGVTMEPLYPQVESGEIKTIIIGDHGAGGSEEIATIHVGGSRGDPGDGIRTIRIGGK
jgi:hypothetical protein